MSAFYLRPEGDHLSIFPLTIAKPVSTYDRGMTRALQIGASTKSSTSQLRRRFTIVTVSFCEYVTNVRVSTYLRRRHVAGRGCSSAQTCPGASRVISGLHHVETLRLRNPTDALTRLRVTSSESEFLILGVPGK